MPRLSREAYRARSEARGGSAEESQDRTRSAGGVNPSTITINTPAAPAVVAPSGGSAVPAAASSGGLSLSDRSLIADLLAE
ncbi:hypothetical protein MY1884_009754, partial [Beauveria asiatica]